VEFTEPRFAEAAKAMDGFELSGRRVCYFYSVDPILYVIYCTLAQIKIGRPNGGAGGVPTNIAMNPLIAPLQHVQLPTSSQVRKYSVTRSSKLRVYCAQ
jgi:hypothetical protein